MKKTIYLLVIGTLLSSLFISCVTSKVEADLITFSNKVDTKYKPYNLEKESKKLETIILNAETGQYETAELFAIDKGLDRVEKIVKKQRKEYNFEKFFLKTKNPNTKYYMVLLTDGLDNVSIELARKRFFKRKNYSSDTQYAEALNNRMDDILNQKFFLGLFEKENTDNTFQAWPIMFYGPDAQESGYSKEDCSEILRPLSGAQNTYIPEPIVESNLETIRDTFKKNFVVTSYTFRIPKGYVNKEIKMEFENKDGQKTAFVATFVREKRFLKPERYILQNFRPADAPAGEKYYDLTFDYSKDKKHKGENVIISEEVGKGSNSALFTIDNLKIPSSDSNANNPFEPYSVSNATQFYMDRGDFRVNSEFVKDAERKENAYIIFVLDTSRSLGSEAQNVKKTAIEIIKTIKDEVLGEK